MAYTDRYLKLPTKMVNIKEADMVGEENANQIETDIWMNPMDISYFRPGLEDPTEEGGTVVELKSGEGVVVLLTVTEFMQRLNEFMK